ncbi:MAG: XcyI family restriction endonuclease [Verrucomicrobia bacterium]|nr:XcyI family restriction endonuclease [Verrucomicrobiota bacterium]NMD21649.1 XcyI family restriction endonuclease [Verrucomicrobiota bacterium]
MAIEIKGGTDKSNIWNRLGEAESRWWASKPRTARIANIGGG